MSRPVELTVREANRQYYLKHKERLIAKVIRKRNTTTEQFIKWLVKHLSHHNKIRHENVVTPLDKLD